MPPTAPPPSTGLPPTAVEDTTKFPYWYLIVGGFLFVLIVIFVILQATTYTRGF
jgi:uncharacterized integral membrane protein